MKLLLDTHALLWFLADSRKLSKIAKTAIVDPSSERLLSPISLLEIAIKLRIDKMRLDGQFGDVFPSSLTENQIQLIPLETRHIEPLTTLPMHHKDPFDRLIIATALVDDLTLVSADAAFDAYGISRLW